MFPTEIHILLVDKDLKSSENIKKVLEEIRLPDHTIYVTLAHNVQEAIRIASQILPQLIITEIDLGSTKDGIEMIQEINQTLLSPVIYYTYLYNRDLLARARNTPMINFLIKSKIGKFEELKFAVELGLLEWQKSS